MGNYIEILRPFKPTKTITLDIRGVVETFNDIC